METESGAVGNEPHRPGREALSGRIHALLLGPIKVVVLPFRLVWLLMVWFRLRRGAMKTVR